MKGLILDEFCATCGYHCKYAIRLLRKPKRKPSAARVRGRPGPKSSYQQPEIVTILKRLWFVTDQMCSKKLKAAIPLWLPFYEQEYGGNGWQWGQDCLSAILPHSDTGVAMGSGLPFCYSRAF